MKDKRLKAADLFCGAGGTTQGAYQSGLIDVVLAVNHWRTAVYSHQANHPGTRHICARIDDVDPRHDRTLPELDVLFASPECTHFSNARGGQPVEDQRRATPWHVVIWAEAKRPRWIVVENVREFLDWGPIGDNRRPIKARKGEIFRQWVKAFEAVGYQVDWALLNAADFGAATKRTRLFIVARRGRSRKDIPWPEPTHAGRWLPAYGVIDWTRPCPSIFNRKRPLAEKTIRRIEIGLRKFVGESAEPFLVTLRRNMAASSICDPLATITAGAEHHALAVPFLTQYHNGPDGERRNYSLSDPLPTIDTQPRYAVATPYVVPHFGERCSQTPRTHSLGDPLPTITGQGAGSLVMPYLLAINHGGDDDRSHSPREPIATLTAKNGHSVVLPFLTKYYGTGVAVPIGEPLDTITTSDRFGLATVSLVETMQQLGIVDIGFRMLDVDELARAQGFPGGYYLHGTKAEQVKQVGNSVSPPVAEAICRAICS